MNLLLCLPKEILNQISSLLDEDSKKDLFEILVEKKNSKLYIYYLEQMKDIYKCHFPVWKVKVNWDGEYVNFGLITEYVCFNCDNFYRIKECICTNIINSSFFAKCLQEHSHLTYDSILNKLNRIKEFDQPFSLP